MHLINVLAGGVGGAANGSARLFRRGTATRAMYYLDFDGLVSVQTGADVTLDANGGATIYVDSIVDVQAFTLAGVLVRSFTAGDMATAVQYKGTAFSGVDPTTGASGANQPVAVKTVLDLVLASFGTRDFLVNFRGTSRNLFEVLSGLVAFYNVQDPLYGAVGDGATDDTAAVQAAIDGASAAGGGIVWFPAGTYSVAALLNVPATVSLLGSNSKSTIIRQSASTTGCLSYAGGVDTRQRAPFMRGISFTSAVTNLHDLLLISGADLTVEQCEFGDGDKVAGTLATAGGAANGHITFRDCTFVTAPSCAAVLLGIAGGELLFSGCRFKVGVTQGVVTLVDVNWATVSGCVFDNASTTTGTFSNIKTRGNSRVSDCSFKDPAGATVVTFIQYVSGQLFESNNDFGDGANSIAYGGITTNAALGSVQLLTRSERWIEMLSNASSTIVRADQYGSVMISTNGVSGTDPLRDLALTPGPVGSKLMLFFTNNSGGLITFSQVSPDGIHTHGVDPGNYFYYPPGSTGPANGNRLMIVLVSVYLPPSSPSGAGRVVWEFFNVQGSVPFGSYS